MSLFGHVKLNAFRVHVMRPDTGEPPVKPGFPKTPAPPEDEASEPRGLAIVRLLLMIVAERAGRYPGCRPLPVTQTFQPEGIGRVLRVILIGTIPHRMRVCFPRRLSISSGDPHRPRLCMNIWPTLENFGRRRLHLRLWRTKPTVLISYIFQYLSHVLS